MENEKLVILDNLEELNSSVLERLKNIDKLRKEINYKKLEKSAEIVRRNNVKKDQKFSRLINKINLKHSNDFQKMKEFHKEMEEKSRILKMYNTKKIVLCRYNLIEF